MNANVGIKYRLSQGVGNDSIILKLKVNTLFFYISVSVWNPVVQKYKVNQDRITVSHRPNTTQHSLQLEDYLPAKANIEIGFSQLHS